MMPGDSTHGESLPSVSFDLADQADDIITEGTNWTTLMQRLDVSRYRGRDRYDDWHSSLPFRPIFLSYLWAEAENESLSGIPNRLDYQPKLAEAMGFESENLPSNSTFRPVRMENRFGNLVNVIESVAEDIQQWGLERGANVGYDPLVSQSDDSGENSNPSKRTLDRLLRRNSKEVLREIREIAIPTLSLPRPDDPMYEDDELLVLEALLSLNTKAANDAGKDLSKLENPEPELDDPFYEDGPSGETLLEAIKQLSVDDIAEQINATLKKVYERARPRLKELENDDGTRFERRTRVAIDMTYVAYSADGEDMDWIQGAKNYDEIKYDYCYKFATISIVGENTHYVVGVQPLGNADYAPNEDYPGRDQSYFTGAVVRRLLNMANRFVDIDRVYADREFAAADVIAQFERRNLIYVVPARKDPSRLAPKCDKYDIIKEGFDEEHDTPLYVEQDYALHGQVRDGVSNTRVTTNLAILPPDEEDNVHRGNSPQPFFTNLDVSDEIALDRRRSRRAIEKYRDRAAIESSYASIKECAGYTTSNVFEVRWFHFAFATIVYDLWLLVDFLVQERINVVETLNSPRITLDRFLDDLDEHLEELL